MTHKLNISHSGKSWKLELEDNRLNGKSIKDTFQGKEIKSELEGYEFEITGGSDYAGFPMYEKAEGTGRKKEILTKGWGLHRKPKGLKKKRVSAPKGLRLRKTLAGKTIHDKTVQINLKVIKTGNKKLEEIFPEQNKAEPVGDVKKEEVKAEEKVEAN